LEIHAIMEISRYVSLVDKLEKLYDENDAVANTMIAKAFTPVKNAGIKIGLNGKAINHFLEFSNFLEV
jgi:hypothetical protein